jgi:hypothetical protein
VSDAVDDSNRRIVVDGSARLVVIGRVFHRLSPGEARF